MKDGQRSTLTITNDRIEQQRNGFSWKNDLILLFNLYSKEPVRNMDLSDAEEFIWQGSFFCGIFPIKEYLIHLN